MSPHMGYNMFDSTAGYENAMLPPIITVQGVLPQEGGPGTTIEIYCALRFPETHTTQNRVRLMFGNTALDASVLICPPDLIPPCLNIPPHMINDLYLVQATVPELRAGGPSWKVPMRMEAIVCPYGTDEVAPVEVVELCDFHYLYARNNGTPKYEAKDLRHHSPRAVSRHRRETSAPYPKPAKAQVVSFGYNAAPATSIRSQAPLMRTTQIRDGTSIHKARLDISGDLNVMMHGWSEEMIQNRRCLVEFHRKLENGVVSATFNPVEERNWHQNMIVISCLYNFVDAKDETNNYFFTSVDAIYLLECLMGTRHSTEEKNRIRRNLESFKPTTLQKNEGRWQDFYQRIMGYPNPKPRNIDKGLKVFSWGHLGQALKKIFGNYSAPYPNTLTSFGGDVHVPYGYVPDLSPSHDLKANLVPEEMDSTIPKMLGHPPSASSSGYSGSATSDLIPTYPLPTDDFTHYVDMSPSATPVGAAGASAARDPPQYGGAQLGLYVPGVDPTLAVGVGYGAKPMAGSDLRVAYDRPVAGMQFKRELQQV